MKLDLLTLVLEGLEVFGEVDNPGEILGVSISSESVSESCGCNICLFVFYKIFIDFMPDSNRVIS